MFQLYYLQLEMPESMETHVTRITIRLVGFRLQNNIVKGSGVKVSVVQIHLKE